MGRLYDLSAKKKLKAEETAELISHRLCGQWQSVTVLVPEDTAKAILQDAEMSGLSVNQIIQKIVLAEYPSRLF